MHNDRGASQAFFAMSSLPCLCKLNLPSHCTFVFQPSPYSKALTAVSSRPIYSFLLSRVSPWPEVGRTNKLLTDVFKREPRCVALGSKISLLLRRNFILFMFEHIKIVCYFLTPYSSISSSLFESQMLWRMHFRIIVIFSSSPNKKRGTTSKQPISQLFFIFIYLQFMITFISDPELHECFSK